MKRIFKKLKQWFSDKRYRKEIAKINRIVCGQIFIKEHRWKYIDNVNYIVCCRDRFGSSVTDSYHFKDLTEAKNKCDLLRESRRLVMINDLHSEFSCNKIKY